MAASDATPWYVRAFDAGYLARYSHRDRKEAAATVGWLGVAGKLPVEGRVLDLCCGAGRHGAALAERGLRVVGLDLSAELLAHARLDAHGSRAPSLVRGSMRELPFRDASFAACVQMFTAFGYFDSDADNRRVLGEVARVLEPGGRYVLDLFNGPRVVRTMTPESTTTQGALVVRESRRYDAARARLEKSIEIEDSAGGIERRLESVRVLAHDEARAWLAAAGFVEIETFGEYGGAAFDADASPRMILCARSGPLSSTPSRSA